MNPEQNQYSIDYLNQIAPQSKKQGVNNKLFFFVIIGGVLLILVIGLMLVSKIASGPTQKMETLAAQLSTLQTISTKAQPNIRSNALRAANSSMTLLLTNANRDIIIPFKNNGVDVTNLDKTIKTAESGSALIQTLENARLNAVYDRIYAHEMTYQLATVIAEMKEIYTSTNSASLKTFLNNTYSNLQPIDEQFSNFNDPND